MSRATVVAFDILDGVNGLTEREPGREIERDRTPLLTLVIELQGADVRNV